jgi:cyanophycin synthetase
MMVNGLPWFFNRLLDFYWKKKRTLLRSARRRGYDLKLIPRVPTAGVTGSVGKTTTCRMVAHILAQKGLRVALSTTQGAYVGREVLRRGDLAGGDWAGRLLVDPRVQAGVFELARGGLIQDGMVLSSVDVGAVLNVYDNHVGLDGVCSRDDLALVKTEVARRAKKLAVLNADDPLCLRMREHVTARRLCLITAYPHNPAVLKHVAENGLAVLSDSDGPEGTIRMVEGGRLIGSFDPASIPASWGGVFAPAVNNAMFAAAIAHGLGMDWHFIKEGLAGFHSTCEDNPGRMNFIPGLPYEVLLTWADGPQALSELATFVRRRNAGGRKHLMLCAVGNRPEPYVLDSARSVAGAFDSYICSDWSDLRGRESGEIAGQLSRGLLERGIPRSIITVAQSHEDALQEAFTRPSPGDMLVVVTYGEDEPLKVAQRHRPVRCAAAIDKFMEKT